MLGDSAICAGFGFYSRNPRDIDALFSEVQQLLKSSDLVFGNLEAVLSFSGHDPGALGSAQMRGDPTFAQTLRRVGFDVISVANNHADQHGEGAFWETIEHLETAGIRCCGLVGDAPWVCQPVVLTRSGMTIGVLGYSCRPRQYGTSSQLYAAGDLDEICGDVRRLQPNVDAVIVSLHWGEEFVSHPSAEEVELGHAIIDAGAVLVVGHHPHVIRPVERYKAGFIAYSLGNFVADMLWQPSLREGVMLRCHLSRGAAAGIQIFHTYINDECHPIPTHKGSIGDGPLVGLEPNAYQESVRATVRAQQRAAYAYAFRNIQRYPPRLLLQLVARTLRGKVTGLLRRNLGGT